MSSLSGLTDFFWVGGGLSRDGVERSRGRRRMDGRLPKGG